jgi:MFS family permease
MVALCFAAGSEDDFLAPAAGPLLGAACSSLSVGTAVAALANSWVAWLAVGATVMLASFSAAVVSALAVVVLAVAASWADRRSAVAAGFATLAAEHRWRARPWFRSC